VFLGGDLQLMVSSVRLPTLRVFIKNQLFDRPLLDHDCFTLVLNFGPVTIELRNGTCDEWFWVDLKVKHRSKAKSFPVFIENNGN
ncbi:hypothetical protein, partial [Listeria monocytogenes]|uniref:hypothetical protein n=1 Tax=Listeria monocytogenes TaxID=1639 RepID=UPI00350E4FA2